MSRKFFITIILILFLLPFVSWYYLQSGLNWRKKAQEIMDGTKPFPVLTYTSFEGLKFNNSTLENHVSIVSFRPCTEDTLTEKVLRDIYNQFRESNKANFIQIDSCAMPASITSATPAENWYTVPCNDTILVCEVLRVDWPVGKAFALVDRNGIIRSYYGIKTQDDKRILVEHMALLLPRERQEKVELKRGNKK